MGLVEDVVSDLKTSTNTAFESYKHDLSKLRTGRANVAILDNVRVNYYGTATPLTQCANLQVADARLITVKPWDRGLIGEIEKAIRHADIGINPQNDGELIRLPIPALNQDRRRDLVKNAKARAEDAKISLRNSRRDANEMLKEAEKDKEISQDDLKRALELVQHETDHGTKRIDELLAAKEKEIMEV